MPLPKLFLYIASISLPVTSCTQRKPVEKTDNGFEEKKPNLEDKKQSDSKSRPDSGDSTPKSDDEFNKPTPLPKIDETPEEETPPLNEKSNSLKLGIFTFSPESDWTLHQEIDDQENKIYGFKNSSAYLRIYHFSKIEKEWDKVFTEAKSSGASNTVGESWKTGSYSKNSKQIFAAHLIKDSSTYLVYAISEDAKTSQKMVEALLEVLK